jgi:hypothetical protein
MTAESARGNAFMHHNFLPEFSTLDRGFPLPMAASSLNSSLNIISQLLSGTLRLNKFESAFVGQR